MFPIAYLDCNQHAEPSPDWSLSHVQEVTEDGGFWELWLNRWQCVFSLDTGMFYISFLIVS